MYIYYIYIYIHIYIYIYNIFKKSQIFALFPILSKYALKFEFKIKSTNNNNASTY